MTDEKRGDQEEMIAISEARNNFNSIAQRCVDEGRRYVVVKNSRPYVVIEPYRPKGDRDEGGL